MKFILCFGLVFCLLQIALSYQCFKCNGPIDSKCGVEFDDETTEIENCEGDCMKYHYEAKGEKLYFRQCAGKSGCEQVRNDLSDDKLPCQTCSGNYCNNGP